MKLIVSRNGAVWPCDPRRGQSVVNFAPVQARLGSGQ